MVFWPVGPLAALSWPCNMGRVYFPGTRFGQCRMCLSSLIDVPSVSEGLQLGVGAAHPGALQATIDRPDARGTVWTDGRSQFLGVHLTLRGYNSYNPHWCVLGPIIGCTSPAGMVLHRAIKGLAVKQKLSAGGMQLGLSDPFCCHLNLRVPTNSNLQFVTDAAGR